MDVMIFDENEIEADIQNQLDKVNIEDDDDDLFDNFHDDLTGEVVSDDENDNLSVDDPSMVAYLETMRMQSSRLQIELAECEEISRKTDLALESCREPNANLLRLAEEMGEDPNILKTKIIDELDNMEFDFDDKEIELDNHAEIQNFSSNNNPDNGPIMPSVIDENQQEKENKLLQNGNAETTDDEKPAGSSTNGVDKVEIELNKTQQNEESTQNINNDEEERLVESRMLERSLRLKLRKWEDNWKKRMEKREKDFKENTSEIMRNQEEREKKRIEMTKNLEEEMKLSEQRQKEKDEKLRQEAALLQERIEESMKKYQAELEILEIKTKQEHEILNKEAQEASQRVHARKNEAATKIQAQFRGHRVRKIHGEEVKQRIEDSRREKEEERIRAIEEEKQRLEAERLKKEMDEIKIKREEEDRIKEEKRLKREQERKMLEEERQRKEEEEKKRKEEEKRKKEEEKQRKEEEKQRKEEEKRRKEEERKREEEEKRKMEEEKKRREEEEKKRQEEVKRQEKERFEREQEMKRLEEERLRKELEEKKRVEEEKRKQKEKEEAKQREEERLRQEEELRKKIEEENRQKLEKEKIAKEKEEKESNARQALEDLKKSRENEETEKLTTLPEKTEKTRLAWIKTCTPWSQNEETLKNRKPSKERKALRRPTSAKKLPPLTNEQILSSSVHSLQQVTTVELHDLPGFTTGPLSECLQLYHLVIRNCNLISVEGLQNHPTLAYADLSHNSIQMINILDAHQLVHLDISHNALPTIHGIDGCRNLRFLSLSHNRITRIEANQDEDAITSSDHSCFESLISLHTLDLSHNQLIMTRGLAPALTLQILDLSHNLLSNMDDIVQLSLLQQLKLSANNIMQLPALSNQVLLQELQIDDNSFDSIDNLAESWLPVLQVLNLANNGLSEIPNLMNCVLLETLNLSGNQISEHSSLVEPLRNCRSLKHLLIDGNPLSEADSLKLALFKNCCNLQSLDNEVFVNASTSQIIGSSPFEIMARNHMERCQELNDTYQKNIRAKKMVKDQIEVHLWFYTSSYELAVEQRGNHETGSIVASRVKPKMTLRERLAKAQKLKEEANMPKELKDNDLLSDGSDISNIGRPTSKEAIKKVQDESQNLTSSMRNKFEMALNSNTQSAPSIESQTNSREMFNKMLANQPIRRNNSNHQNNGLSNRIMHSNTHNNQGQDHGGKGDEQIPVHNVENSPFNRNAATTIQAAWRGYLLRRRMQLALEYARQVTPIQDDDEEFGAVDLSDFDIDVDHLDQGWLPPSTPQIPLQSALRDPGHRRGSSSSPAENVQGTRPFVPNLGLNHSPHPPQNPRTAWRNLDSPLSQKMDSSRRGRAGSLSSEPQPGTSRLDTNRTDGVLSRKEELLAEEWGFKDNQTAQLMMQRAKKLKYNVEKKKKINKLDPKQRLALFRKLEETSHLQPVSTPQRNVYQRKEYFQARAEELQRVELERRQEDVTRNERTYEWLHTHVSQDIRQNTTNQNTGQIRRAYSSDSNLPHMDPGVIAGGRTSLMASPMSMDLQSVDTSSITSDMNQRNLAGNQRHNGTKARSKASLQFPPIKTESAPNIKVKEKMSWRNKETNKSIGWGGGKKRGSNV